jgi:hypothetical protein
VSFDRFLAAIEAPALREIASHWNAARGAKRMPAWKDIDPAAIYRHLPIVWSWKYDRDADTLTGRLSGEEINAVFGRGVRGVPMKEFFADGQYDLIFERYRRVVTEPAFARGSGPVFTHARKHGSGERIIMPLAEDGVHGDGVFGATVYQITPNGREKAVRVEPKLETVDFFPLP